MEENLLVLLSVIILIFIENIGGKTLQLSNKAEFDALRNMVIAAGGKNEE